MREARVMVDLGDGNVVEFIGVVTEFTVSQEYMSHVRVADGRRAATPLRGGSVRLSMEWTERKFDNNPEEGGN